MKRILPIVIAALALSAGAGAAVRDSAGSGDSLWFEDGAVELSATQSNGMSLSQAVESVRRRGNVERIVSAQTRVENGREVHHIRYMTKDGKVRTAKIQGRRR